MTANEYFAANQQHVNEYQYFDWHLDNMDAGAVTDKQLEAYEDRLIYEHIMVVSTQRSFHVQIIEETPAHTAAGFGSRCLSMCSKLSKASGHATREHKSDIWLPIANPRSRISPGSQPTAVSPESTPTASSARSPRPSRLMILCAAMRTSRVPSTTSVTSSSYHPRKIMRRPVLGKATPSGATPSKTMSAREATPSSREAHGEPISKSV